MLLEIPEDLVSQIVCVAKKFDYNGNNTSANLRWIIYADLNIKFVKIPLNYSIDLPFSSGRTLISVIGIGVLENA